MLLIVGTAILIVMPAEAFSAFEMAKPPLAESISIASALFFLITLCIWAFDAVSFIHLRHAWTAKAIWGAGVVSILATSAMVYRSGVSQQRPLEGVWYATARYPKHDPGGFWYHDVEHLVTVSFMPTSDAYVAHSDLKEGYWFAVRGLTPKTGTASVTYSRPYVTYDSVKAGQAMGPFKFKESTQMLVSGTSNDRTSLTFQVARNERLIHIGVDSASFGQPYIELQRAR
jgi:hypothetical protein